MKNNLTKPDTNLINDTIGRPEYDNSKSPNGKFIPSQKRITDLEKAYKKKTKEKNHNSDFNTV